MLKRSYQNEKNILFQVLNLTKAQVIDSNSLFNVLDAEERRKHGKD